MLLPVWIGALSALMAWSITVGYGSQADWFDEQRILMLMLVTGTVVLVPVFAPPCRRGGLDATLLFVASAAGLLSAVLALRPEAALAEWASLTLLAASAGVLGVRLSHDGARRAAEMFAATVLGAYAVAVCARYVSAAMLALPLDAEVWQAGLANPRFVGQLLCLSLPLLPLVRARCASRGASFALAATGVICWAAVIGSGSRTAWLALLIAATAVALVARGAAARGWLAEQSRWFLGGALLYVFAFMLLPSWLDRPVAVPAGRLTETGSVLARLQLWNAALDAVWANPLLGVGPMHLAYADHGLGAHPHNFWLQLAAEWGLVVLLAWLWFAGRRLRALVPAVRDASASAEHASVRVAAFAAFVAWLVATQFDGVMVVPSSQIASLIVLALTFAVAPRESAAASVSPPAAVRAATAAICSAAVLCMLSLPFTALGEPTSRLAAWRSAHPMDVLWPRFWSQGWIGPRHDPDPCAAGARKRGLLLCWPRMRSPHSVSFYDRSER